jgi:hypothetical protein
MYYKKVRLLAVIGALAAAPLSANHWNGLDRGTLDDVDRTAGRVYAELRTDSPYLQQFVTIPDGFLPLSAKGKEHVSSFEAAIYPVTQEFWGQVMQDLPAGLKRAISMHQRHWDNPRFPVSYVSFEDIQEFLGTLNRKTAGFGHRCVYDLPTDSQLHYMIRGDREGTNTDRYSKGVTFWNSDEYLNYAHWPFPFLQYHMDPVGVKRKNAFGIELGNIFKVTKTPSTKWRGQVTRGGCFGKISAFSESDRTDILVDRTTLYNGTQVPGSSGWVGFQLVRTCTPAK